MSLAAILGVLALILGSACGQQDIECLREFKSSVNDPQGSLSLWTFPPNNSRAICNFAGVQCLHSDDSRVYTISLSQTGLTGSFPKGLNKRESLTGLDISENALSGNNICSMLPYLVDLDIHSNAFTGSIVSSFVNCSYLIRLDLSSNRFTGAIPAQFPRLKTFDVSNNDFSGLIPSSLRNFPSEWFVENPSLCGPPLKKSCPSKKKTSVVVVIAAVAAGSVLGLAAAAVVII